MGIIIVRILPARYIYKYTRKKIGKYLLFITIILPLNYVLIMGIVKAVGYLFHKDKKEDEAINEDKEDSEEDPEYPSRLRIFFEKYYVINSDDDMITKVGKILMIILTIFAIYLGYNAGLIYISPDEGINADIPDDWEPGARWPARVG